MMKTSGLISSNPLRNPLARNRVTHLFWSSVPVKKWCLRSSRLPCCLVCVGPIKNKQRAIMPVVFHILHAFLGLVFLKFFEETSELAAMLLFIGEEFDAEVLCDVIYPIT